MSGRSPQRDAGRVRGWAGALGTRGLPPAFWWLWASTLVNRLGTFAVPFLTLYLTVERGRSAAFAGLVAAAFAVGGTGGALAGGAAADRFGCRRALVGAHLGTAAATAALGLSTGPEALFAAAFALGCTTGAARPATAALMSALLGPGDRVRAFSLDYWAMNLGFSVSVLLAGLAARTGYPVLFLADAAATLLCALVVLLRVPSPPSPPPCDSGTDAAGGPAPRRAPSPGHRALLADRPFLCCVLLFVLVAAVLQQMTTMLPVAMAADGLSPAACGTVIALNGVLVCLAQLPAGRLFDGRSPFRLLALAAALCGTGFGLTAFAGSAPAYALTVAVWTAGEVISGPVSLELTARFARARAAGRYQGASAFAWSAGGVLAAAAGGWTYDRLGPAVLWSACALAGLTAAAGFLALARHAPAPVPSDGPSGPVGDHRVRE
ncbi:MFS transporter [Kitasatospora sp. NPDC101176]|uniref:MFS transporter n=1 Tax=Kitasatospora sp. NPDC101176 TaxID=3364099 RepID=UPI00382DFD7E